MIAADDAPVLDAAALRVARPDHEVGLAIASIGAISARQGRRVVRPVGVHLDDDRGAAAERLAEPVEVRPAEALLGGPMLDADARIGRGEAVGELAGPVGRAVVHDQQHGARAAPRGSPR